MTHSPGTAARPTSSGRYIIPTTHRVHHVPRYESRPYRPSPARREHIYGSIQPMDAEPMFPAWAVWLAVFAVSAVGLPVIMGGWK